MLLCPSQRAHHALLDQSRFPTGTSHRTRGIRTRCRHDHAGRARHREGEVPSTTALDNQHRLPAPARPGTWTARARSAVVDTAFAIALVTMIPLLVVTGMTAILWAVGTLVSLAGGA